MRRIISAALMLALFAMVAGAKPASAQEITRSVVITRDSKVGGKQVSKGDYEIKFVEGKDGELVLLKGKQEISKASYKVTKLSQPAPNSAIAYNATSDGAYTVKRIEFKGKSEALVLE
ncbi:MAG TPA: hypothetical protein VKM94_05735 [Blastocatellia bacterium]|nr:hypothetical protein [Blastocatellia bacterium]